MKKIGFFLILLLISILTFGQLSGVKTIPGDYSSFGTAVTALQTLGVSGPVTFNVAPGIYSEQISIGEISGASDTSRIIFQAANGDSTSVVLTYPSQPSDTIIPNYLVNLAGADYFTFKKMTFERTGANDYAISVIIDDSAQNNTFESCRFFGVKTSASTFMPSMTHIYSGTGGNEANTVIKYCRFVDNYLGIYFTGSSAIMDPGLQIINNIFEDQYRTAIDIRDKNAPIVTGNIITSQSLNTNSEGIRLDVCDSGMIVSGNKISLPNTSGGYGIKMLSCDGTSSVHGLVSNNFVHINSTSTSDYGIYCYFSQYQKIYNNSVNVTGNDGSCFYIYSGGNINIVNNIFANNATGLAAYFDTPTAVTAINNLDYNNYYTNGNYLAYWIGYKTSLSYLQDASGKDTHSFYTNPQYKSASDLHCFSVPMNGKGTLLPEALMDIDGETRDLVTPDIGADEYMIYDNDAGAVAMAEPLLPVCRGLKTVKVKVYNYGKQPLTSVTINWSVNSALQTPFSYSGLIPIGDDAIITIGSFNFANFISYNMKFWTSNPNGVSDQDPKNDTISLASFYSQLTGVYSIGGTGADFATFTDAANYLNNTGVCGPVTFNVASGTYTEQVKFTEAAGASGTNTITFQSLSGDSSSVILTYPSQSSDAIIPNYVVKLDGADFFTFRKMTIERTDNKIYSRTVEIDDNAQNNTFEFCRFLAYVSYSDPHIYSGPYGDEDNTVIKNCRFIKNGVGINFDGRTSTTGAKGIQIIDNIFENQSGFGLRFKQKDALVITGNTITCLYSSGTFRAIIMEYCNNGIVVSGNKISLLDAPSVGIELHGCSGKASAYGLICNNFIHISGSATDNSGIYCHYDSEYQKIYNNSVNVTGSDGRCIYVYLGGNNINIVNNIFANNAAGIAAYYSTVSAIDTLDYNDYYTTGSIFAYWNGNKTSLSDLQAASGKDIHSLSLDPEYVSDSDLHRSSFQLDDKGTPLPEVTVDIDGEARSPLYPDIGADEYLALTNNLAIVELINIETGCGLSSAKNVTIKIANFGTATQSNIPVKYSINGGTAYVNDTVSGSVAYGDTITFTFSTKADFFAVGSYWVIGIVDNVGDENHHNDTIKKLIYSLPIISSFPYSENFEGAFSGWLSQANSGENQWELGDPEKTALDTAHSGQNAWVTKLSGDYDNMTDCFLLSPCMDFRGSSKLMISVWLNFLTQAVWDAMILEASTDNGITWDKIGGSLFYNNYGTYGLLPPPMWSGTSNGWKNYKTELTGLAGLNNVKFRFRFVSSSSISNEGFTIDDISILELPVVSLGNDTFYCTGSQVILDAGTGFNAYLWSNGDTTQTISVNTAGTYSVTATDTYGFTSSDTIIVSEQPLPIVSLTAFNPVCIIEGPFPLSGELPPGGFYSGAGVSGGVFTPSVAGAGTHAITYTYTDGNGCTNSATKNITVTPLLPLVNLGPDTSICTGDSITLSTNISVFVTDLFFSEYIEGSSFNKALEIYNGTSDSILLDNYRIAQSVNGGGWQYYHTFPQGAKIPPMDVWTIVNSQVNPAIFDTSLADEVLPSPGVVNHNGDDARSLQKNIGSNWITIDIIGDPNNDPGIGWNVAGVIEATANHTLVRKQTFTNGNTSWSTSAGTDSVNSEWIVYPQDEFSYFTTHNITGSPAFFWNTNETSPSINVSPSSTTTYSVTVTNIQGSCAIDSIIVTVNPLPVVTLAAFNPVCINALPFALTGGSPAGGIYTGTGASGGVFTPSVAGVGVHTITYTYTAGSGCTNSAISNITVYQLPAVTLAAFNPLCISASPFALTGGSPAGGIYTGTGVSGGIFTPSVAGIGTHTITYTYTDGNGCTNFATSNITVYLLPTVTLAAFNPLCISASPFALTGGSPAGGIYTGTGVSGGIFTPSVAGIGTHTITYTYTDGNGCTNFATGNIIINSLPIVNLGNDTIIYANQMLLLDAGAGFDQYLWSTGDNTQTIIIDSVGYGVHTFWVKVWKNGCEGIDSINISIIIGISENNPGQKVLIYPNPNEGRFIIQIDGMLGEMDFTIFDMQGQVLYNETLQSSGGTLKKDLNLMHLATGVYFVRFLNDEFIKTEKIIIN